MSNVESEDDFLLKVRSKAFALVAGKEMTRAMVREKMVVWLAGNVFHQITDSDLKDCLERLLNELEAKSFISDRRYSEMFVRHKYERGHGPRRVKDELRARGVSESIIESSIVESDEMWLRLATKLKIKKFGDNVASDWKERSRQVRYLISKGFSVETATSVVKNSGEEWASM